MVPTRRPSIALLAAFSVAAIPAIAVADGKKGGDHSGPRHGDTATSTTPAPATIALPAGYQPEGIASGPGGQLYVGSIPTGAVYRADPRTGAGSVLVPGKEGRAAIGLKVDRNRIIVAGGPTGHAFIYDAKTGADVADVTLTTGTSFVNDVTIAGHTAYFTDSQQQQLYRVALGGRGDRGHGGDHEAKGPGRGKHGADDKGASTKGAHAKRSSKGPRNAVPAYTAATVKITGDLAYDNDPATYEANGIAALPGGKELLVVQSGTGKLFRVDGTTGASVQVPISGGDLVNGDGLLLKGKTLYVVQNRSNKIAVVKLAPRATSGAIERTITNPAFRVPTTIARQGGDLFAVNARFGTPATPTTDYDVVRIAK